MTGGIGLHNGAGNMRGLAGKAAVVTVGIAGVVENMGSCDIGSGAVHTFVPVVQFVGGPLGFEFVDMGALGFQNSVTYGTNLVGLLGGFGAGDMLSLVLLVAANFAGEVVHLLVVFHVIAEGVVGGGGSGADGAYQSVLGLGYFCGSVVGVVGQANVHFCGSAAVFTHDLLAAGLLAGCLFQDLGGVPSVVGGFFCAAERAGVVMTFNAVAGPGAISVVAVCGDGLCLFSAAGSTLDDLGAGVLTGGCLGHSAFVPSVGGLDGFAADGAGALVIGVIYLAGSAEAVIATHGNGGAADAAVDGQAGGTGDVIGAEGGIALDLHIDGEDSAGNHSIGLQQEHAAAVGSRNLG